MIDWPEQNFGLIQTDSAWEIASYVRYDQPRLLYSHLNQSINQTPNDSLINQYRNQPIKESIEYSNQIINLSFSKSIKVRLWWLLTKSIIQSSQSKFNQSVTYIYQSPSVRCVSTNMSARLNFSYKSSEPGAEYGRASCAMKSISK